MLTHACNSSIQEAEAGRVSQIQGWLGLQNKTQAMRKKSWGGSREGWDNSSGNKCLFLQNNCVFPCTGAHTQICIYTHQKNSPTQR